MTKYYYDYKEIDKEIAKAIIGKRATHVIDTTEKLSTTYDMKVTIYKSNNEVTIYIAQTFIYKELRSEKVITIRYGRDFANTDAYYDTYKVDSVRAPLSHGVHYKDWVIPNPNKLTKIITTLLCVKE